MFEIVAKGNSNSYRSIFQLFDSRIFKIIVPFVLFFLYFCLYLLGLNEDNFFVDENDVFAGGIAISKGYMLYVDYMSQHMPFTYYLSALLCFLGAKTTLGFRIYYYVFFSLSWMLIYLYFKKYTNKLILILTPIIFISLTHTYNVGTVIVSEHIASIGFVTLLLVFIKFYNYGQLKILDYIIVSLSLVFTVGTIFVSVFAVFVLFLGFLIKEFIIYKNESTSHNFLLKFIKKYWMLFLICAFPWFCYILYLIITNSLKDAIFWSTTINLNVYNKYLVGRDVRVSPLTSWVGGLFNYAYNTINFIMKHDWLSLFQKSIPQLFALLFVAYWAIMTFLKKKYMLLIIIFIFLFFSSPRGLFSFHGTPCMACISLLASSSIINISSELRNLKSGKIYKCALFIFVFIIIIISTSNSFNIQNNIDSKDESSEINKEINNMNIIMDNDEAFWGASLEASYYSVATGKPKIYEISTTPWFWEVTGVSYLDSIYDKLPKVLFLKPTKAWEYKLEDYAPDFIPWVKNHYIQLDNYIWIKNEFYSVAFNKINTNE